MKNLNLFAILFVMAIFFACQPDSEKTEDPPAFDPTIIQGTWKMSSMQPQDTNVMVTPTYTQIKIFGAPHFALINLGENHSFNMALGGTYEINEEGFTEKVLFYSGDSTFIGTEIPYTYKADEGTYHQSGVIVQDSADNLVIEESYERVEDAMSKTEGNPLVGVWRMTRAAYGDTEEAEPLEEGEATYKIITPGHFYVVSFNWNGKFGAVVFGTHKMEGDKYVETIISSSMDSTMNGQTPSFDYEVADSSFTQIGAISYQGEDNYKIEEYFTRVE